MSTYENQLVTDDTVPEDLRVVDRKKEELLVSVFCPTDMLHIQNHFPTAGAIATHVTSLDQLVKGCLTPAEDETSC